MSKPTMLRRMALATCPWLALTLPAASAQQPTLADPDSVSDLGYLLKAPAADKSASGIPAADAPARARMEVTPRAATWPSTTPSRMARSATTPAADLAPEPQQEVEVTDQYSDQYQDEYQDQAEAPQELTEEPVAREHQPAVQGAATKLNAGENTPAPRVEVIRERYPNRLVRIEREVTQDDLGNYLNHGSWKMWDERGTLMAEGRNLDGEREGVWNRWHARGDSPLFSQFPYTEFTPPLISQAEFKAGQLDGQWTIYDAKQRKISQWQFAKGQRHGLSTWWHPNGKKLREITYKDGAIDGDILEYTEAGQVSAKATFQQGRKLAPRMEKYPDGAKKTQGMYLHAPVVVKQADDWWNALPAVFENVGKDERHGDWMAWYPNGQEQLQGHFQNDKEDGRFTWWYPNGQKATEGEYKDGRQQGAWVWWHKNGQKATEGDYRDGDQIGRWTVWNEKGRVTQASEHAGDGSTTVETVPVPGEKESTSDTPETARVPRLLTPAEEVKR